MHSSSTPNDDDEFGLTSFKIHLPHPIDDFDEQTEQLVTLYKELTQGFLSLLEKLEFWETTKKSTRNTIIKKAKGLPNSL